MMAKTDQPEGPTAHPPRLDRAVREMAADLRRRRTEAARARQARVRARPCAAVPAAAEAAAPTPERLRHAAGAVELADGTIDHAGERPPRTRRFRDTPLDRLRGQGRLTDRQHRAACWYLARYEAAAMEPRTTALYAERAAAPPTAVGDRLLRNDRALAARLQWRAARASMPDPLARLVDDLVLHRAAPVFANGRQRAGYAEAIGRGLDAVADWLGRGDKAVAERHA